MPQAAWNEKVLSLVYGPDSFQRQDESNDGEFYARTRMVEHLDGTALATVEHLIEGLVIEDRPRVLDLMAGPNSHLPPSLQASRVVGLGLNREELKANKALTDLVIHDLNQDPKLPFSAEAFDLVLCTVAVDYLTRPFEVFQEIERVLAPGGLCLVIFSNRMFPTKAIKIWREASQEERIMIVEDYFFGTGFYNPSQFVVEGLPRPADDKYAGLGLPSDPLCAVFAEKRGGAPDRPRRQLPMLHSFTSPPAEAVLAKKALVKDSLACPYCDAPLTEYEVPQTPFVEWDSEMVHVCLNDNCPYLLEGWSVMRAQGNPGFSYRLMYDAARDTFYPMPVPSLWALKNVEGKPRG